MAKMKKDGLACDDTWPKWRFRRNMAWKIAYHEWAWSRNSMSGPGPKKHLLQSPQSNTRRQITAARNKMPKKKKKRCDVFTHWNTLQLTAGLATTWANLMVWPISTRQRAQAEKPLQLQKPVHSPWRQELVSYLPHGCGRLWKSMEHFS